MIWTHFERTFYLFIYIYKLFQTCQCQFLLEPMLRTFLSTQNARLDDDSQSHGSSHPAKTIVVINVSVSNISLYTRYTLNYQPPIHLKYSGYVLDIYPPLKGSQKKMDSTNKQLIPAPLFRYPGYGWVSISCPTAVGSLRPRQVRLDAFRIPSPSHPTN